MPDTDGHAEPGRWLTQAEAAAFYAVDVRTIQRWEKAGRLKRHPTARPPLVWVPTATVPDDSPTTSDDARRDTATAPDDGARQSDVAITPAERLSDIIRQNTAPLLEALERSEERARELERERGRLQERNAALERVVDVVRQMSDDERQRADAIQAERDHLAAELERRDRAAEGRRWWQRMWGR